MFLLVERVINILLLRRITIKILTHCLILLKMSGYVTYFYEAKYGLIDIF